MKKNLLRIFLVICAIALSVGLYACNKDDGDVGDVKESGVKYFDISTLNYNANFSSDGKTKGFFIYDQIKLNKITVSESVERRIGYEIKYTLKKDGKECFSTTDNTKPYTFTETGKYDIEITAGVKAPIKETYNVEVKDGGRPTQIDIDVEVDGETADCARGGKAASLAAKVYNNGTLVEDFTNKSYKVFWEGAEENVLVKNLEQFGNLIEDEEKTYNFVVRTRINTGEITDTVLPKKLTVKSNLLRTEYDYDWDKSAGLTVDVNKNFGVNFSELISLKYVFDNEDEQVVEFSSTGRAEGKAVAYIKYEGKDDYVLYNTSSFPRNGAYNTDMSKYNFDPTVSGTAQVYLSVCGKRKFSVNNVYNEKKVEGSDISIDITRTAVSSMTAESFSGKYASYKDNAEYDAGADYTDGESTDVAVNDGSFTMFINRGFNALTMVSDEYVTFNVKFNEGASAPEYVFSVPEESREALYVSDTKDDEDVRSVKLYAFKSGEYKLLLRSVYGDVDDVELTVNVTNPCVGYRATKALNAVNNYVWLEKYNKDGITELLKKKTDIVKVYMNSNDKSNVTYTKEDDESGNGSMYYFTEEAEFDYDFKVLFSAALTNTVVYNTADNFDKFTYSRSRYEVGLSLTFSITDGLTDTVTSTVKTDGNAFSFFVIRDFTLNFEGVEMKYSELISSDKYSQSTGDDIIAGALTVAGRYEGTIQRTKTEGKQEEDLVIGDVGSNATVSTVESETLYITQVVFDFLYAGGTASITAVTLQYAK